MAELTAADLKLYLRISGDAEDALITAQIAASTAYLMGKLSKTVRLVEGGTDIQIENDPLFQQCIKLMVAHWYENREIEAAGVSLSQIPHTVDAILAHIEGCSDYE